MAQRALILFAHPAIHKSRVNKRLVRAVRDLEGVKFRDLYEIYPEFDVDVRAEQKLLESHELIVLQHPLLWYSIPSLLKEWLDLVLEHGWAYGSGGTALRGKRLLSAITAGGGEDAYCRDGVNRFTIREFLAPVEQTAVLCGMEYLPPYVVHGTHRLQEAGIHRHAEEYRRVIEALLDDRIDLVAAKSHPRINSNLDAILTT